MILYFTTRPCGMLTKDRVQDWGLGYALDEKGQVHQRQSSVGPGGPGGLTFICGPCADEARTAFVADEQIWEPYPGADDLWLGYWKDLVPGPDDLAREEQVRGYPVRLGDRREWLVPCAREWPQGTRLPRRMRRGPDGWAFGDVRAEYQGLFDDAGRVWNTFIGADAESVTITDGADIAVRALAVNYRLGPAEVGLLGLFDEEVLGRVLRALVDMDAALAAIKDADEKKAPDAGSGSMPGGAA